MKKTFIYRSMVALFALTFLGSCSSLFDNPLINKNPNSPEDASIDKVMIGGQVGFSEVMEDTDVRIAMMWSGHLTGLSRQHLGFAEYIVTSGTSGWGNVFNAAAQFRIVQDKAAALNTRRMVGAGKLMEVMLIAKQASLFGDVPYSQALDADNFPKPVYDKMSDAYTLMKTKLDEAIVDLAKPVLPDGGTIVGDFLYGGDATKWLAAAHTMKARLALHTGDYATAISEAQQGISSTAGDMLIPHGTAYAVDMNLHFVFFDINRPADTGCEDPTVLPNLMLNHTTGGTNESRLWNHYFQDAYYTDSTDPNTVDGFFQADSSHPALTFYENNLILAEALARRNTGSDLTDAVTALNAVRTSLATGVMYGQTMPARGTLSYPAYTLAGTFGSNQTNLLTEILTTKYILMFGQLEVYNDLRRCQVATPVVQVMHPVSGNPIASSPIIATPTGRIPDRYIYPQNQINTNPNVPKTGTGGVADQWQKLEIWQ